MLSSRQKSIISYLIWYKNFVSIKFLSNLFHLSERSIQYDLQDIQYYAEKEGAEVIRNKRYGVKLNHDAAFEEKFSDSESMQTVLSPEERKEKILIILFESLKPMSSNQLAQLLYVTRRTVVDDMKGVRRWLLDHFLQLAYIKNKGFSISGDEQKFRESYVEILIKHYQSDAFSSDLKILTPGEIALVHRSIDSALDKENDGIVQTAIDGLVFHIAVTIHRVRNNFQISMPEKELARLRNEDEFQIARRIQETVERNFSLHFPESEIGYITLHLLGAKHSDMDLEEPLKESDYFYRTLEVFIKFVGGFMGIDLTEDPILLRGLAVHLKPALYRMMYNMRNDNPLKNEIETNYPNVVKAVDANLSVLEDTFQVTFNEDEIAYITLHIGSAIERNFEKTRYELRVIIVCASGVGTSQLLKSKIENYYPELSIYDSFSVYDIDEDYFTTNQIDLVITTIPTPDFPVPVIKVSPFLTKDDRDRLNDYLNAEREKAIESGLSNGPVLNELITPECVVWDAEVSGWKEAISLSTELLVAKGSVTQNYTDAIIKYFEMNGPYMVIDKGVALPHAKPSDGVQIPGISFTKLRRPVYFGHSQYDPVYFVICLATTDTHIHLNALRQLTIILQDDDKMKQIKEGDKSTFLDFVELVSQQ